MSQSIKNLAQLFFDYVCLVEEVEQLKSRINEMKTEDGRKSAIFSYCNKKNRLLNLTDHSRQLLDKYIKSLTPDKI